jgi:hypothetical protein
MVSLGANAAMAGTCGAQLMNSYRGYARIVDSIRFDKGGQQRVFAFDGTEFTVAQARWMHAQLHKVELACANGDESGAAPLLEEVGRLITAHQRFA